MSLRIKSKPAPDVDGKPAWYGLYFRDDLWRRVCNRAGEPIVYTTPEYAEKAAVWALDQP